MSVSFSLYNNYKSSLGNYSQCINPILDASFERYFVQINPGVDSFNLEKYCAYERRQVNYYRNLIKLDKQSPLKDFKLFEKEELDNLNSL